MGLHEPRRARHDHGADRVGAHDVGIVVDLDPPGVRSMPKAAASAGQQLLLARRLGQLAGRAPLCRSGRRGRRVRAFRRAAAPRFRPQARRARPGPRPAGPGSRPRATAGRAGAAACRGRTGSGSCRAPRRPEAPVGARIIGAVAPVLIGAEEEDLDGELPGLLTTAKTSASSTLFGLMPCAPWTADSAAMRSRSRAARSNSMASAAAIISAASRSFTARLLPVRKSRASSTSSRIVRRAPISPVQGARAALDLIEQAGPRTIIVVAVGTGAEQKGPLQRIQRAVDRPDAGEGAEIVALAVAGAAMLGDLRRLGRRR